MKKKNQADRKEKRLCPAQTVRLPIRLPGGKYVSRCNVAGKGQVRLDPGVREKKRSLVGAAWWEVNAVGRRAASRQRAGGDEAFM